jgi:hypothetical protein
MSSFIDNDAELSGQDSGDDSENSGDNYQVEKRDDNKNIIYEEDYVHKNKKERKKISKKDIEESNTLSELELPVYSLYFEKTVSQIKMWLPKDPFLHPMRHVEVQENQSLLHSIDE